MNTLFYLIFLGKIGCFYPFVVCSFSEADLEHVFHFPSLVFKHPLSLQANVLHKNSIKNKSCSISFFLSISLVLFSLSSLPLTFFHEESRAIYSLYVIILIPMLIRTIPTEICPSDRSGSQVFVYLYY